MSNQQDFIYINEKLLNQEEAFISIDERGFLFGDGLFETCRFINNKIINFEAHLARIKIGLFNLKFNAKIDNLEKKCYKLIKKNNLNDGIIRISISRGIGSRGYLPTYQSSSLIIIQTKKLPIIPHNIKLITCDIKPHKFNFKSANSLPYVLAKIFAHNLGYYDAILCDDKGYICETSSANIFWIKDNIIYTPSNDCPIIYGTIRQILLECRELKIKQGKFKISHLKEADEVFISNASFGIMPITTINFNHNKNYKKDEDNVLINYKKILVKNIAKILQQNL